MNRFNKVLIVAISLVLFLLVGCETIDYTYTSKDEEIYISAYTGTEEKLIVPDEYNGKIVTTVLESTYAYNIYIIDAVIGKNIKSINACAFWYCTSLETIYIGKSVKNIEMYAFHKCPNLKTVYYEGTMEEWANINIGEKNDDLLCANVVFEYTLEE